MGTEAYSAMVTGFGFTLGGILVGTFVIYLGLIFVLGLMFYYFTGNKPGESIINNFMRISSRFYAEIWMILSTMLALSGLFLILKVIIGSLFNGFVYAATKYGTTTSFDPRQADVQTGLTLFFMGIAFYAIHWGISFVVETREEKKGTLLSKSFNFAGLFISGSILFGSMLSFVLQLITYFQSGASTFGVKPGLMLAMMLASMPVWALYLGKSIWMSKKEA